MAEDLARREGMSLQEWLSKVMAEAPQDATSQDYFRQGAAGSDPRRVTDALERLSDRIESAESRQALAIAGIERSVREVIARIDAAEREQMQVSARLDGAVSDVQTEQSRLSERVLRIELENQGPRAEDAVRALEGAIGKVADRVDDAERRARETLAQISARVERIDKSERATSSAIRDLRGACADLDGRIGGVEGNAAELVQTIADNLSARVESVREDLARQLAAASTARFDRIEQALAKMGEHVRAAEQRSANALERMGHEVLQVAQNLNTRVQGVEHRSAEAAERVGGQISRIANAVENRLARADAIQAQALEKLGGEIARITERLADRIAATERRSAQAIDDVGEQVARVTERVSQRQERSTSELAERIRQSEERTARLLEEARQKIDERLAESQRRFADLSAATQDDEEDGIFADASASAYSPSPRIANPYARPAPATLLAQARGQRRAEPAFEDADFEAAAGPAEPSDDQRQVRALAERFAPAAPEEDEISSVALEPNVGFDMDDEDLAEAADDSEALEPFEITAEDEGEAARAEDELDGHGFEALARPDLDADEFEASLSALASRIEPDELEQEAQAPSGAGEPARSGAPDGKAWAAQDRVLEGLTFGRARKTSGGMTGALMVASLLAAVSVAAGGFLFLEGEAGGKLPKRVADALTLGGDRALSGSDAPLAAVALSARPAPPSAELQAQFAKAVTKVEANQPGGLADMRRLGDAGLAQAQFYLSKLYEEGRGGAKKDPVEARRWVERAAEGGDRAAMHNLALDYFEGVGGPRNVATAAEWFRRAAELGLLDSQFNLAGLYEHGDGVSQNAAEAYKWYLVAGRAGDAESKAGALRVRALLTPQARAVAERAAAAFQPAPAPTAPPATSAAASPDLVTAQRALNQLGYYQGPTDGAASPALHLAIAAYQRDQGLAVTGAPDATTIAKLAAYTQ